MKNHEKYTTPEEKAEAYIKSHPVMIKTDSECSVRDFSKWLEEDDGKKLKPCPFCGGKARARTSGVSKYVICCECECRTPTTLFDEEAISIWNKRV